MSAAGADLELRTRLVRLFEAAGLANVYAESRARLLRQDENDFAVADPSASTMSPFLVSARGQGPARS